MGAGLAEVAARAGYDVIVRSRSQASADAMVAAIERSLAKQVERGKAHRGGAAGDPRAHHRHRPTSATSPTATS